MENVAKNTTRIFLAIAGISVLCCLARPDFNLPLFIFAWQIWSENDPVTHIQTEKLKVYVLMLLTLIVDLVWLIYWGSAWGTLDGSWALGVKHFVYFLSLVNFILKAGVVAVIGIKERDSLRGSIPETVAKMLPAAVMKG